MAKALGILAGGIFIGAVGVELFRKAYPGRIEKAYGRIGAWSAAAKEAFMDGYYQALGPEQAEATRALS
ncbi:MAG TPA: hypothetical protein HPP77_09290 [Candidatus Hydrogenedentes bacterium]|nr:hypothetical protein [Candidatus Hydrogenedentota bacterium]